MSGKDVVFVAGGTGILPALRTMQAMLEVKEVKKGQKWMMERLDERKLPRRITLLWGVRDLQDGILLSDHDKSLPFRERELKLTILSEVLRELKTAFNGRLTVHMISDKPHCAIRPSHIQDAMGLPPPHQSAAAAVDGASSDHSQQQPCFLHNPKLTPHLGRIPAGAGPEQCKCAKGTATGKNVLVVSGPDGFVGYVAGSMRYPDAAAAAAADGTTATVAKRTLGMGKTQGQVGGMVGEILERFPEASKEWMVLKLDG
jgi:hypothetical protein